MAVYTRAYAPAAFEPAGADAYPTIKGFLEQGRYRSVIFNLDQCGHRHVERNTILDIMHSYPAAEIFYTFVISSLLAFLQKDQPQRLRAQLDHLGLASSDVQALDGLMSQKDWLGAAEKIVFDAFRLCAPYVSLLVVDEVHSSDDFMGETLRQVLRNHVTLGGHALLLSATLGAEARVRWRAGANTFARRGGIHPLSRDLGQRIRALLRVLPHPRGWSAENLNPPRY